MVKVVLLLLIFVLAGCAQPTRGSTTPAVTDSTPAVAQATAAAIVHGTITVAPGSGYAGTFVDVSGAGWPASTLVLVKLADEQGRSSVLTAIAAGAEGHFTTGFVYPVGDRWLRPGVQTVVAHTEDGQVEATAPFTVAPPEGVIALTATPTATVPGNPDVTPAAVATAAAPAASITATITFTAAGLASTTPNAAVAPFAGPANTLVTVSGGGFRANTSINIALAEIRKASEPGSLEHIYATATTDNQGNYSVPLTIPATWPDGTLVAEGQIAILVATTDHRIWVSVPFDYLGGAPVAAPTPPATPAQQATPQDLLGNDASTVSAIDALVDAINGMPATALAPKLAKSLTKKLRNAQKEVRKENPCTAVHMLGAFQNEVEAQRGKQIADGAAALLSDAADHLIAQLLPGGKSCRAE